MISGDEIIVDTSINLDFIIMPLLIDNFILYFPYIIYFYNLLVCDKR